MKGRPLTALQQPGSRGSSCTKAAALWVLPPRQIRCYSGSSEMASWCRELETWRGQEISHHIVREPGGGNCKECSIAFGNRLLGEWAQGGKDRVMSKSVAARAQPSPDHRCHWASCLLPAVPYLHLHGGVAEDLFPFVADYPSIICALCPSQNHWLPWLYPHVHASAGYWRMVICGRKAE